MNEKQEGKGEEATSQKEKRGGSREKKREEEEETRRGEKRRDTKDGGELRSGEITEGGRMKGRDGSGNEK